MKVEEFKVMDADEQRWTLYGTLTRHMADPHAHRNGSRLRRLVTDGGPVMAILGAIIILLEATGG